MTPLENNLNSLDEKTSGPLEEYKSRHALRLAVSDRLEKRSVALSAMRLVAFAAFLLLVVLAFFIAPLSYLWSLIPLAAFAVLVVVHGYVIRKKDEAIAAADFYAHGMARLENNWAGKGSLRTDLCPGAHLYATDLDLFGEGSLFDLMCTARTGPGEEKLASWLMAPADPDTIEARQRAVDELRGRLDLREEISWLGGSTRSLLNPKVLRAWAEKPPVFTGGQMKGLFITGSCFAVAAVAAVVLAATTNLGILALIAVGIVEAVFGRVVRDKLNAIVVATEGPSRELLAFSQVLKRMEREPVASDLLVQLQQRFAAGNKTASSGIQRLGKLVNLLDQGRNQFFAPIAFFVMWRLQFALAIERWRVGVGPSIADWLDSSGAFDALTAISGYAYEHPSDPFPSIERDRVVLDGEKLGHPLVPDHQFVRNSVRLDDRSPLWVVSGSNMSGKSTLLRVVGINAVLAMAGAPVRAESLHISPVTVGSTIHILDSLQTGKSKFYAEISDLKQLVDLARGERTLLFLLDEILHGTNSHDRKIGAEAVVRGLLELGAVGLVTTHDLALAEAADALGERARNVHFDDTLEASELSFDYKLKPGVVTRSNALELMRSVGLDV